VKAGEKELALRNEQRLTYALALMCLVFWGVDALSVVRLPWDTLGLRGAWAALTVAMGWALGRVPRSWRGVVRAVSLLLLPNLFLGLVVWRLGGVGNPLFGWFCVLPVATLVWSRGDLGLGVLSTLGTLGVTGGLLWVEGVGVSVALTWMSLFLGAGVVGLQTSLFHRRLREGRVMAEARRRAVQEALVESQARVLHTERLAQVGRLAAGVAHEVNNPLAFIQANLRFLQEEWQQPTPGLDSSEYADALRETMQGVERIREIVKELTAVARGEQGGGEVGRCELGPVIEASVRLASVRLKSLVRLAVEVPSEPAWVRAEPRRLGQVLLNLLLNAADAIEEGRVEEGRVTLRVEGEGEGVRLVVEDNGPGIKPESLGRLFTPFFTTKVPGKGTGLGLALSRQYVESFGGHLRAENRSEGGARFVVELKVE
jgi:two-component system, sensor histidine kinase PhcS